MKFDPLKQSLYSNDGRLIKRLFCPKSLAWNDLGQAQPFQRYCASCEVHVIDTAQESDESMIERLQNNPNFCIKLDLQQSNITIINHGEYTRE